MATPEHEVFRLFCKAKLQIIISVYVFDDMSYSGSQLSSLFQAMLSSIFKFKNKPIIKYL
jgi:hypothetical protein